jgi:hypothetical protein
MSKWELFAFRYAGTVQPALGDVARELELSDDDIDPDYGVVKIEEGAERSLYVVMIRPEAVATAEESVARTGDRDPTVGKFSNVRQEPTAKATKPLTPE